MLNTPLVWLTWSSGTQEDGPNITWSSEIRPVTGPTAYRTAITREAWPAPTVGRPMLGEKAGGDAMGGGRLRAARNIALCDRWPRKEEIDKLMHAPYIAGVVVVRSVTLPGSELDRSSIINCLIRTVYQRKRSMTMDRYCPQSSYTKKGDKDRHKDHFRGTTTRDRHGRST
jgi:hypothetical protein